MAFLIENLLHIISRLTLRLVRVSVVKGIENAMVEVYFINGQLVYSGNDTTIAVADKGIYIVKVTGKTFKVAL